jgi:3D (Asp-Asp-Asp) domain-containing protein
VRGHLTTRCGRLAALAGCVAVAVALPASSIGSSSSVRNRASRLAHENAVLASHSQAARLARRRVEARRELRIARTTFSAAEKQLAARLRLVYEQGDSDSLSIVLGARSIDDALSGIETVNAAAASDRTIVHQARRSRARYSALRSELAARAAKLERLQATAEQTANALAAARTERLSYIRQVAAQRQLNTSQIGSLESQAQAIQQRATQLTVSQTTAPTTSSPAPVAPPTAPPSGGGRTLTVTATAYTLPGRTATGAPVGYGVVAVDPSVIPLGTRMTIPGYGEGVAADTGGAIQGATIDLWFPSAAAAAAWGRRTVTITLH